jgi:predicted DNA-binding transcriptional regulator YafY
MDSLEALCSRRHGATVRELVQELGLSEKMIRRDLETFQTAGSPLNETVKEFARKKCPIDAG